MFTHSHGDWNSMRSKLSIRASVSRNLHRVKILHICGTFENIILPFSEWLNIYLAGEKLQNTDEQNVHSHIHTHNSFVHRTLLLLFNYLSTHSTNEGKRNYGEGRDLYTNWYTQLLWLTLSFSLMWIHIIAVPWFRV